MSAEIPSIAEASRLIQSKALSPVTLAEQCLARIKTYDGKLNAFLLVCEKEALAQARQAEKDIAAGRFKGPLHGIPIAHKDIYSTKGIRTTAHSKILADHVPTEDATTVRKLAEAGTVMLGKLATHEFAMGGPSFDLPWPPARNPWNYDHVTGGSSSGTGAAIAAGMTLGGTGSDTGGSIRNPSAWCGVSGIKPTYGLCSRAGVFPLSYSLDHTGPMAWTVEDCAILLQAMAGHDPRDPASASVPIPDYHSLLRTDLKGVRVGLIRHFHEQDTKIDPEMQKSLDAALIVLRDLGATITDVRLPPLSQFAACCYIILLTEAFVVHSTEFKTRFNDYCENFRDRAALAALLSGPDYLQAQRLRRQLTEDVRAATTNVDVLVTAALPGPAPAFAASNKWAMFKQPPLPMPCNVTGQPVTTVCTGFHSSGLPLAMQVIGHPFQDATTLAVAHAYQVATPWRAKRPVLKG